MSRKLRFELPYPFMILDGALATEMEGKGLNLNNKLWSASFLESSPELIRDIHLDYYRAGADFVTTASYQASLRGLLEYGYDRPTSLRLIKKSVEIARQARDLYYDESCLEKGEKYIAGSIGSYGSYLADGSEYSGNYFLSHEEFKNFHRDRLEILITSGVDIIAFETFPRFDEALAVFNLMKDEFKDTPFWISFVTPDGIETGGGDCLNIFSNVFSELDNFIGPGINCSHPDLVMSFMNHVKLRDGESYVVYPNSGEGFDTEATKWTGSYDENLFRLNIRRWSGSGAGIIGGCCRTTPETVSLISQIRNDIILEERI